MEQPIRQLLTTAVVDGACARALAYNGMRGSIHQVARHIRGAPGNGWQLWHYQESGSGALQPIDVLREQLRGQLADSG